MLEHAVEHLEHGLRPIAEGVALPTGAGEAIEGHHHRESLRRTPAAAARREAARLAGWWRRQQRQR